MTGQGASPGDAFVAGSFRPSLSPFRGDPGAPAEQPPATGIRFCEEPFSEGPEAMRRLHRCWIVASGRGIQAFDSTGAPVPVIGNPQETPRPFGMTDSDGIVNTGAMIPAKGGVLGGLVFGDHADVIGHYDRSRDDDDPKGFQRKADTGLLDSGSGFQDDAFFQLYRAVADAIHPGPRTTARTPPKPRPAR